MKQLVQKITYGIIRSFFAFWFSGEALLESVESPLLSLLVFFIVGDYSELFWSRLLSVDVDTVASANDYTIIIIWSLMFYIIPP